MLKFLISTQTSSIHIRNLHHWLSTDNKKKSLDDEQYDERCLLEFAEKLICDNESGESQ